MTTTYTVTYYTPQEFALPREIAKRLADAINIEHAEFVEVIEREGTFYIIHRTVEAKAPKTVQSRNR